MNELITIIVPVYNVEKYLAKCLDSLIKQDYDNYEVLVINDGSPYNEQVIIDDYQNKYSNIIKSIKKENGGYGSVLQLGIKEAKGDFILVCDSDDYLESNCLSTLYNNLLTTNSDISIGAKNLVYMDNNDKEYDKSFNNDYGFLSDRDTFNKGDSRFNIFYFIEPSPHSKLYKRDLLLDITFPVKISFTDNILYFCALAKANKVVYSNKALSNYLINREGNTKTDNKPAIIDQSIQVYSYILDNAKDANPVFYYRLFESFFYTFYLVETIKGNKEVKKQKYDQIYGLLDKLLPFRQQILDICDLYKVDNNMRNLKEELLTKEKSKQAYDEMVDKKLNNNLFFKIKRLLN